MSSPVLDVIKAHRRGERVGLYSVCSSHPLVLRAALQVAKQHGSLLLVEATSNQVDQFGGYTGMKPAGFRDYVQQLARRADFPLDQLVLGGDHLGPNAWQKLDAASAMQHAQTLIDAYVSAGFHKIHLDCSMRCADDPAHLSDEVIAERSALLAQVAEAAAARCQLPPPVYVIGTEVPVPGGEATLEQAGSVTTPAAAARTLEVHRLAFMARGLRAAWLRVAAMVVQPGVDFDHSRIQHYQADAAADLSAFVAGQPGLVFEAHSTDYQREAGLHALVRDHFAILKVGPALSFAMREALLALSHIEAALVPQGAQAHLMEALDTAMREKPQHWRAHYSGNDQELDMMRRFGLSDRCRYYWGEPQVAAAMERLFANIDQAGIALPLLSQYLPEQYASVLEGELAPTARALVEHKIGAVLHQYARACRPAMAIC